MPLAGPAIVVEIDAASAASFFSASVTGDKVDATLAVAPCNLFGFRSNDAMVSAALPNAIQAALAPSTSLQLERRGRLKLSLVLHLVLLAPLT